MMGSLTPILDRLEQYVCSSGGFPYTPGHPAMSEPTLLSLLALWSHDRLGEAYETSMQWVLRHIHPSGAMTMGDDFPAQGFWTTPHLYIFAHHAGLSDVTRQAGSFLMNFKSRKFSQVVGVEQDNSLVGWPWTPDAFAWVEPTSWALLALEFHGEGESGRCGEGRNLILDRKIQTGGWNYGNALVYNSNLIPFKDTTALALMAVRGHFPPNRLSDDFAILKMGHPDEDSIYSLAWVALCLKSYGQNPEEQLSSLLKKLEATPGEDLNIAHQAIGLLALSEKEVLHP